MQQPPAYEEDLNLLYDNGQAGYDDNYSYVHHSGQPQAASNVGYPPLHPRVTHKGSASVQQQSLQQFNLLQQSQFRYQHSSQQLPPPQPQLQMQNLQTTHLHPQQRRQVPTYQQPQQQMMQSQQQPQQQMMQSKQMQQQQQHSRSFRQQSQQQRITQPSQQHLPVARQQQQQQQQQFYQQGYSAGFEEDAEEDAYYG
jgi:hypothetical protein